MLVALQEESIWKGEEEEMEEGTVTVPTIPVFTKHSKERRFLYFNHLSKEFLEQMIPHLKALI